MFKAKLAAFVHIVFNEDIPVAIRYVGDSEIANPDIHLGMIVNVGALDRILLCEDDLYKVVFIDPTPTDENEHLITVKTVDDPQAKELLQGLLKVSGF